MPGPARGGENLGLRVDRESVTRIDISAPAENAAYLFNVGDFMLLFSTAAGTSLLAIVVYGTSEFRPYNVIEAALQGVITVAALGYVPLRAWRGYARRYWLAHAILGALLTLGIAAGIPAVLASEGYWTWARTIVFAIFSVLFLALAAIPLGFALSAKALLRARVGPSGTLLSEIVQAGEACADAGAARRRALSPRTWAGAVLIGAGVIGIAAVIVSFTLYGLADKRDAVLATTASNWIGALVYTLPVSAVFIGLGRRLSQADASCLLAADQRAPILLLRSFGDDAKQIRAKGLATRALFLGLRGRKRLESAIAPELARRGPFIAIGRPGEMLPQLGASRAYLRDDEWQSAVADWIARARGIVMIAGTSSWVQWELREIARARQIGKLLLLLPPGDAAERRQRLELAAHALGDARVCVHDSEPARVIALRLHGNGNDAQLPRITLIESATAGEVDYELAIRVADFDLNRVLS